MDGKEEINQVSAGYVRPYADVLVAIRSCGQAFLWSCYVVLARGIVWAKPLHLLSLLVELRRLACQLGVHSREGGLCCFARW